MFTVYSKDNCPYCDNAKKLLESKGLDFQEVKLDRDITKEELLKAVPGIRSFPHILDDNKPIGGFTELSQYVVAQEVGRMSL